MRSSRREAPRAAVHVAPAHPSRFAAWLRCETRADAWASYGALALACVAGAAVLLSSA